MNPAMIPARVTATEQDKARHALAVAGAVVLTGLPPTADSLVLAAALVHGDRLRELYPLRERGSTDGGPVHLHADSLDIVVDVGGVPVRRRHPDEDAVFVQCIQPAPDGGESFVVDAYEFVDSCDPELAEFLHESDVDLHGAWAGLRGHRDPAADHVTAMLDRFAAAVLAAERVLPRFSLAVGDVLALDNYRCWHGRDPHSGQRLARILTLRTVDAR